MYSLNQGNIPDPKTFIEKKKEQEQYFFTDKVLEQIITSFQYFENIVCICAPSVADAFWRLLKKEVYCIDIDDRFNYLPKFINCDITKEEINLPENFVPNIIIVDPPFFKMRLIDLYKCIDKIAKKNKKIKLVFAFVIREDKALLSIFKDYNLQLTKFPLEYKGVDKTKWGNYGIYTNFEKGKFKYSFKKKNK